MNNKISIIINNYNYARFLKQAIDSVLQQTIKPFEIIIVDDGSTDNSKDILGQYHDKIRIISKPNGGQASAFNTGFNHASGDWIWFVDADDWLMPDAVSEMQKLLEDDIVKLHAPLKLANEEGNDLGIIHPLYPLSEGVLLKQLEEVGDYIWPPTTGNIFSRKLLENCMPMPEQEYRLCADFYLCSFAAATGRIKATVHPVGYYRVHSSNGYFGFSLDKKRVMNNGMVLLRVADRMEELVRKYSGNRAYQYPFTRYGLEALTISRRFGGLKLPQKLSGFNLHKKWLASRQFKKASAKAKLIAIGFWIILNYAPKPLAARVVKKGVSKGQKAKV
jgi:glycosyltransferase involved in cell wall biosynthesis